MTMETIRPLSKADVIDMNRAVKAWRDSRIPISRETARLIARYVAENGNPNRDHSVFFALADDGVADFATLAAVIQTEEAELSSDFAEDIPMLRALAALAAWTRENADRHVTGRDTNRDD